MRATGAIQLEHARFHRYNNNPSSDPYCFGNSSSSGGLLGGDYNTHYGRQRQAYLWGAASFFGVFVIAAIVGGLLQVVIERADVVRTTTNTSLLLLCLFLSCLAVVLQLQFFRVRSRLRPGPIDAPMQPPFQSTMNPNEIRLHVS
jgi:hypothetical protein